jgi:hypothetical protein
MPLNARRQHIQNMQNTESTDDNAKVDGRQKVISIIHSIKFCRMMKKDTKIVEKKMSKHAKYYISIQFESSRRRISRVEKEACR